MTNSPLTPRLCRAGLLLGLVMACSDGPHTPSPTLPGPPRVEPAPRSAEPAPEVAYAAAPAPPQGAGGEPAGPEAAEGGEVSRQAGETRGETANTPDPPPPPADPPPPPEDPGGEEGEEEEEKKGEGEEEEENQPRQEYPCDSLGGASISARTNSDNPSTAVDLTWGFSTEPECEQDAVFNVTRGTDSVDFTAGETSTTDTPLDPGMRHCYTVTATTADGEFTSGACAWTNPATPTGFRAGHLSENDSAYYEGLQLNWDAVSIKDSYEYRQKEQGKSYDPPESAGTGTSHRVTDLISNKEYCYQLRTVHGTRYSDWTTLEPCATVPVEEVIEPPSNVGASAWSSTVIRIRWSRVTGASGYTVKRITDPEATRQTTATQLDWNGLSPASPYCFQVATRKNTATSTYSTPPQCATTGLDPPTRFGPDGTTSSTIDLVWTEASRATSYQVRHKRKVGGTWSSWTTTDSLTRHELTRLRADTIYLIEIRSRKGTIRSDEESTEVTTEGTCDITSAEITAPDTGQTWVDLNWEHQSRHCDSVVYDVSGTGISLTGTTRTSGRATGLSPETEYRYTVEARQGSERATGALDVTTLPPTCVAPSPPSAPTASVLGDDVPVSWGSVSVPAGCTSVRYRLSRDGTHLTTTTDTSYTDEDLDPGEYAYRVAAESLPGSHRSREVGPAEVTVPMATPDPPTPPTCDLTSARIWETGQSQTWVDLEWTHGDNTHCDSVVYDVTGTGISLPGTTDTSGRATGLTAGQEYPYTVTARQGSERATDTVTVTTSSPTPTCEITGATIESTGKSQTWADLGWSHTDNGHCSSVVYDVSGTGISLSGTTDTSGRATGLAAGTEYPFTVTARQGSQQVTDTVTVTTPATACRPGTPGGLRLSTAGQRIQIGLDWDAPASVGCSDILYRIDRRESGAADYETRVVNLSNTEFTDHAVACGLEYEYQVYAVGDGGVLSDPASASATRACPAPCDITGATIAVTGQSQTWVELSWSHTDNGTCYAVQYDVSGTGISLSGTADTSGRATGLAAETGYAFTVTARQGREVETGTVRVTTDAAGPPVPANVSAETVSAVEIRVTWDAAAGAEDYELQWSTDGGTNWSASIDVDAATAYDHPRLIPRTTYTYRVRSRAGSGAAATYSGWSDTDAATTKAPGVPASLTAEVVSATSVRLRWDAVEGAARYDLGRRDTAGPTRSKVVEVLETSYLDTGLTPGQAYVYDVMSVVMVDGTEYASQWSGKVSVTPVLAKPELTLTARSSVTMETAWTAVATATAYELQWFDGTEWQPAYTGADRTYPHEGRTPGSAVRYRVRALRTAGGATAMSGWAEASETMSLPLAPANLTAEVESATSVRLSWDAVEGAARYDLGRRDTAGPTRSKVVEVLETSYLDTGLTPGQAYMYDVMSVVMVDGTEYASQWSGTVSVTPVLAKPELTLTARSSVTMETAWTAVAAATAYELQWFDGTEWQPAYTGADRTYPHEGRTPGSAVRYRVRALRTAGGATAMSGWAEASETMSLPLAPANLTAEVESATSVRLSWDAVEGAARYDLGRRDTAGPTRSKVVEVLETSYLDTGLTPGQAYVYDVMSVVVVAGREYASQWSGTVSVTPVLPVPTGVAATAESSSVIALTWEASEGAASYEFQWKTAGAADWNAEADAGTGTSHRHTGREADTEYAYQVRAASGTHRSGWSGEASARTPAPAAPAVPTGVTAEADSPFAVTVAWVAVADADSYTVRRQKVGESTWETMAASGESLADTDLAPETSYRYQVQSVRGALRSDWSSELTATTDEFTAPTEFTATAEGSTSMELTWEASPGTGLEYRVRWREPGGSWTTQRVSDTSYTVTRLTADTLYDFRIVAYKRAGSRGWHRTDAVDIEARTGTE